MGLALSRKQVDLRCAASLEWEVPELAHFNGFNGTQWHHDKCKICILFLYDKDFRLNNCTKSIANEYPILFESVLEYI